MQLIQIGGWIQRNIQECQKSLQPFLEYATLPPVAIFQLELPDIHAFFLLKEVLKPHNFWKLSKIFD